MVTILSSQFMLNIKKRINIILKQSPIIATTPSDNNSESASTSLVVLVIRRPIGFLSKN